MTLLLSQLASGQTFDLRLMKQASVIIIGTISQLRTATFPEVPLSTNTSVVKIEQVLQQPASLSIGTGDEITLELRSEAAVGDQATFYADGWIVGKGIALREIGRTPMPTTPTATQQLQTRKAFHEARQRIVEEKLRARADSAEIIMLGEVMSTRPTTHEAQKRITEHDPNWHDAIVKVNKALKGTREGSELVVRFSGSIDVAFYNAPKLKKGDERVMLLRPDTRTGLPKAIHAGKETATYIIDTSSDMLEKEQWEQLTEILKQR